MEGRRNEGERLDVGPVQAQRASPMAAGGNAPVTEFVWQLFLSAAPMGLDDFLLSFT
jgi:hypothetical protein